MHGRPKDQRLGVRVSQACPLFLQGICGVEPGLGYDGVPYSLSILCLAHTLVLGFSSREVLLAWDARVRYSLGEGRWFWLSM